MDAGSKWLIAGAIVTGFLWLGIEPANAQTDPAIQCSQSLAASPQFARIAKKLPLANVQDISVVMLADRTYATPVERQELADWFEQHDNCNKSAAETRKTIYAPAILQVLTAADDKMKVIGSELYARRITFGEADRQLLDLKNDAVAKVTDIVTAERTEAAAEGARQNQTQADADAKRRAAEAQAQANAVQAEAQAEAARQAEIERKRAVLAQFFQQQRQQQQDNYDQQMANIRAAAAANAANRGKHCTTSYIGNQAYTNCY